MTTTKFKNTEIGRIPEDWEVKELGKSALIKARIGWQGLTTQEYLDTGEYYLVTGTDFKDGKINWSGCHFVTKARYDQDKFIQIKKQDVLVSKDGTIGKVAYLDEIPGRGTLNSGVFVIRSKDSKITQPFLAIVFLSKYFDNFIDKILAGSTIVHLYQKDIVNFTFPLPPSKAEQSRIASALFDIDTLIRDLDRTIEKKKNIRQGAMEQLLSGKKRLPGFIGEWEEKNFDDIFGTIPTRGKAIDASLYQKTGKYPIIDQGQEKVVGYTDATNPILVKKGGYLVFGDHTRIFKFIQQDFFVGADGTKVLACKDNLDTQFMYYKCLCLDIPNTGYNRHFAYLKEASFVIPSNIKEQYAIADTLTAMDDEIAVLQIERDKYANIRSGMMDDLLTGRKRL